MGEDVILVHRPATLAPHLTITYHSFHNHGTRAGESFIGLPGMPMNFKPASPPPD